MNWEMGLCTMHLSFLLQKFSKRWGIRFSRRQEEKNKTEYIGDSESIDLKSEDEDDGIWQVKYSGTKFTAASSSLTATVVGSSDDNDIYKDEFTRGTAKRALLSSTAVNITLPLTEW